MEQLRLALPVDRPKRREPLTLYRAVRILRRNGHKVSRYSHRWSILDGRNVSNATLRMLAAIEAHEGKV
jgi:hypothetical protein